MGSTSGVHAGQWINADDSRTFIFKPDRAFDPGETVSISFGGESGSALGTPGLGFNFEISSGSASPYDWARDEWPEFESMRRPAKPLRPIQPSASAAGSNYMLPGDFPPISILVNDNPEPGNVFLGNLTFGAGMSDYGTYVMILENDGTPVFFKKTRERPFDFKVQPNGLLTYCVVIGVGRYYVLDNTYTVVDSIFAGNGYTIDRHGLQFLPNGHTLFMIYDPQPVDMSEVVDGGDPDAIVVGLVIQELDTSKNVVFQWRSWDHIPITDANQDLTDDLIDYVHGNAVELDHDGNILLSGRSLEEITKINRDTGEILWRMGGKANEFTLFGDTQWFSRQHDIRRLPNGNITLWNNGNFNDPVQSRAVEYAVDEENKTATLVWEYRDPDGRFGSAMGNAQRLPGGNTMTGWGNTNPNATEARPDGTKAFELTFPDGMFTYRAFRLPWSGVAAAPYAWTNDNGDDLMRGFDKFGDDGVARYLIYRSDAPLPDMPVAWTTGHSVRIRDFEAGEQLCLRVTAEDHHGRESPFSNAVCVTPESADVSPVVAADVDVRPKTLNAASQGQWVDARIELPLPHDARDVDLGSVRLNAAVLASSNHADTKAAGSRSGNRGIAHVKFSRDAVIDALDGDGTVEVNVTGYVGGTHFEGTDVIRLIRKGGPNDGSRTAAVPREVELQQNSPNPFNPVTTIRFTLSDRTTVKLDVYSVDGRLVRTLVDETRPQGTYAVQWDGHDGLGRSVSSGIYLYRLVAGDRALTKKMLLLK